MPTSAYQNTVFVLDFLSCVSCKSLLDVGAGFGRWGFLSRCHLGGGHSLEAAPDQEMRIDAIEAFKGNISAVYRAVYNSAYFGDAREVVSRLGSYEVLICGDMIEHLPKDDALRLIEEMKKHASKALVLSLPLGECAQGASYGNEYEIHRSTWSRKDFSRAGAFLKVFPYRGGVEIGVAIWPVSEDARWFVKNARNPARAFVMRMAPRLARNLRRFFRPTGIAL